MAPVAARVPAWRNGRSGRACDGRARAGHAPTAYGVARRGAVGPRGYGRPVLHTHRAESGAALVEGLAELLAAPVGDPFAPEVVAVPARGVERWIAQRLSHRLGAAAGDRTDGVCAHVRFPRPDAVLDDAVAAASPQHAAAVQAWAPERAGWALIEVLDSCPAGEQWCAGLRHHLGLDGPAEQRTRRWAVARRLTGLFASYAAARPALLRAWAAGADDAPPDLRWQPELWRRLRAAVGTPSPAELLEDACAALRARPDDVDLPARLSLYGTTRIDAARLQVLAALAAHRDVHLWLPAPSPVLWERLREVVPPQRRADVIARPRHPLLASLSRDVRELQLRLAAAAPGHADHHHPGPPAGGTLLARLQADLRDDTVAAEPRAVDPADRSVQVHACHGRARQVEVLREVVLGLLQDDPSLEPRDVLVMCPDVEAFAPLVAAAFGTDAHPGGRLRVSLADRSPRQLNPLLGLAAQLLELAAGRVTSAQVLDVAGAPAVRLRFGFDDDALEQLRGWTVQSGVRWGLDAEARRPWRMHGLAQGTWRAGVDRLLMGVAVEERGVLVGGVLPLDDVESSDVDLAGRCAELVDRLGAALGRLRGPQPVGDWLDALEEAVLALTDVPRDGGWQLAQLRRELGAVRATAAGSTVALTLTDVTALLEERLAGRPTSTSFRTGGTTVCTLTPMRSVPHRVVCLLGLDDGAFPRSGVPDGDDLLARDPHLGERDPRSEDRQLLLDALLAAQEHLVVTYAGHDVRTGAELAPAVPLGELLDALEATASGARRHVLVRHPLQPFDARSFTPGELGRPGPLSFDASALAGARAAGGEREEPAPFLAAALPPPPPENDVELVRVVEFLQHPAKAFLRQRLEVQASSRDEEPADALPVALDALQEWAVGDRLLAARLRGAAKTQVGALEVARGTLPPGPLADGLLAKVGGRVDRLVEASAPYRAVEAVTADVEVHLPAGRRLLGQVGGLRGDCLLTVTYSSVRARQRLRAWVELLALQASRDDDVRAVVVGRAPHERTTRVTLGPVSRGDALQWLAELVEVRDTGLRAPLPLPVGAGEAYAAARRRGATAQTAAYGAARKEWESGFRFPREDVDPEHQLVWDGTLTFAELWAREPACEEPGRGYAAEPTPFARLARRVWQPLLDAEVLT